MKNLICIRKFVQILLQHIHLLYQGLDGSLVFIKNIYGYIVEDANYEYDIILDIPENKKSRKTDACSYTYEVKDSDKSNLI